MKNKSYIKKAIIAVITIILVASFIITANIIKKKAKKEEEYNFKILTSFYPIYIMTINITDGAQNVETENMTEKQAGCIHDYTLTTADLKKFEKADLFIQNGLELESFMDKIINSYPDIIRLESAQNVQNLIHEEHEEEHESHEEHEEEHEGSHEENEEEHKIASNISNAHNHESNGHVWLSIENYISQVDTISKKLFELDESNKNIYEENSKEYIKKLTNLKSNFYSLKLEGKKAICLNEALEYLLEDVGMEITMVETDHEQSALSAKTIQDIIKKIKEENINAVFVEKDDDKKTAETIANETNAKIYVLDSNLNGEKNKNSYINAMKANYEVLKTVNVDEN